MKYKQECIWTLDRIPCLGQGSLDDHIKSLGHIMFNDLKKLLLRHLNWACTLQINGSLGD